MYEKVSFVKFCELVSGYFDVVDFEFVVVCCCFEMYGELFMFVFGFVFKIGLVEFWKVIMFCEVNLKYFLCKM